MLLVGFLLVDNCDGNCPTDNFCIFSEDTRFDGIGLSDFFGCDGNLDDGIGTNGLETRFSDGTGGRLLVDRLPDVMMDRIA